jgi:hypothetical protein
MNNCIGQCQRGCVGACYSCRGTCSGLCIKTVGANPGSGELITYGPDSHAWTYRDDQRP